MTIIVLLGLWLVDFDLSYAWLRTWFATGCANRFDLLSRVLGSSFLKFRKAGDAIGAPKSAFDPVSL